MSVHGVGRRVCYLCVRMQYDVAASHEKDTGKKKETQDDENSSSVKIHSLFRDITQFKFGSYITAFLHDLSVPNSRVKNVEPIRFPETSVTVTNHQYTLLITPEERKPHLHRGQRVKSDIRNAAS